MSDNSPLIAPEARLTIDGIRWMAAGQLAAIGSTFFAFGAALLLQQASDRAAEATLRDELGARADALISRMNHDAASVTYSWIPVSLLGWLLCIGLLIFLMVVLFISTKGISGWSENRTLYKLLWAALGGGGSALVVAAFSNAVLQFAGGGAPWWFILPAIACLAGYCYLNKGLWGALWEYYKARRAAA